LTVKYLLYYYQYKMYFTIPEDLSSSPGLPPEAKTSLRRLRLHAQALSASSPILTTQAHVVADAYRQALSAGGRDAWAAFVSAAAALVRYHREAARADRRLAPREEAAAGFFDQIARENVDLLVPEPALA